MSDIISELHSVDTWRELAFRAVDEIERLRSIVDIASNIDWSTLNALEAILIASTQDRYK